jgi:PKD repeat protein
LIATNSGDADTILKQQYITVTQQCKPQIYFSATPTSGIAPLQVQFTETDNFNNNLPTSWLWDFGDHTSDATKNPVHTFLTNGGFRISLSATNNNIKYTAFGGIFVYGVSSTTGVPARLYLSASSSEFPADGLSTTTGQAYILDANGNLITNGSNIVSFTLTGPGMIIGQNPTTFMAGLATILVKSSSTPGIIILTAVSPALTPSTVTFTTLGCQ